MRITKVHWIGIIFAVIILGVDLGFFLGDKIFWFLIGIGIVILSLPFLTTFLIESNIQKEKDSRFLEFSRNLAESVKSGTPIGQSIINMQQKNFGSLTPHIHKLANQISLGIPINKAFETFGDDVGSHTVKRAVSLIREAERAGGQIDNILDSVANSIYQIQKLRKERKSAIYNLVVQGYIIFFIFIGIMLIMQFKILPLTANTANIGTIGDFDADPTEAVSQNAEALARPFLYLLLIQGIFTGLTIGKLSEGTIKAGIKHSFALTITAFLISTGAKAFL
ncbi:MAG: type II secretion system F family protein [Bacteroidetes bacterium]|nr:type II secretion system F family protein [Bacteroidota bacterium]